MTTHVEHPPPQPGQAVEPGMPELFLGSQPRPLSPAARLKALIPTVVAVAAAILAVIVVVTTPGPLYIDPGAAVFLLVLLVGFPFVLLLTLAIHEGGHLLAAALAGLDFRLVTVGPFRLAREIRGLRLTFVAQNLTQWQGNAFCLLRHERQARPRLMLFLAGGPLATLAQTAVFLLLRAQLADTLIPFWLAQLLFLMAYCPLAILPFTLFPMRFRGIVTDAAQLLRLWRQPQDLEQRIAVNLLIADSIRGVRPSALSQQRLDILLTAPADSEAYQIGNYLAHLRALDGGDVPAATHFLQEALRAWAAPPTRTPPPAYLLVAAMHEARFGRGTAVAGQWLNLLRLDHYNALAPEIKQLAWQAQATIWQQAGQPAQARAAARHSLHLLSRTIDHGYAQMANECLTQLLTAVPQPPGGDTPTTNLKAAWQTAVRRPRSLFKRSLTLLALLLLMGILAGFLW